MKTSSQLKLLLTIRMTECTQKSSAVIDESVRTVYHRQKSFSLMVWATVSKYWKLPLIFVKQKLKINTDLYINNIVIPAFEVKSFQRSVFHLQTRWSTIPDLNKKSRLVKTSFSKILE